MNKMIQSNCHRNKKNVYFIKNELDNEELESLKEKIAEAQYDYTTLGAQIQTLEDESNRYDT